MLALFHAKFACNLAISNLVFRWESCKGSVWESVKKCSNLCKVAGTRNWNLRLASHQMMHTSEACRKDEQLCQLERYRTKSPIWQFFLLAAWTKSPASYVLKNLTLRIPFSLQYKYPLYPRNVESFQREYWERNPRENQDWLIHNLYIETFQIPLLLSSPLLYHWEVHYQNLFSPYPHLWECHLVLRKQLGRDQFHIGWCYGL